MSPGIHEIVSRLADPQSRGAEAARLASEVGAEAFIVLLHDEAIDALTPAPGFPQTLPGGPAWRAFLKARHPEGAIDTELPFPGPAEPKPARVLFGREAVFILIGGEPRIAIEAFAQVPLLSALLRAEAEQLASVGLITAAREATHRATNLAAALDRARAEVRRKADELAAALDQADRLNEQLQGLNETLEQRVSDEIRERLHAEEALRQAQKMEAVGQLTGGVAHDFNNLLTVIMGGLDSMRREIEKSDDLDLARLRRMQSLAFQAAERAATLTSRLLAFARRQPLAPKPVDLNKLVAGLSDLLQRTLGETVALETVSAGGLWLAHADPAELESALMNLAINARDAMPRGGKLTIETANVSLDEDYVSALVEPVPAGQYVMLAVSDTGEGMKKETIDRVFEPFFTTKEAGKGTGLGLSQVYGFVRQSGGHIRIYSEPGEGATVKLYLPRDLRSEAAVEGQKNAGGTTADGGSETILVIEDHDGLREYSVGVLRELGYHVLEAADGQAGLKLLRERPEVDLLFTDVVLPGLNGRQLADQALAFRPDLKVLFTTGYTRNAIVHNGRLDDGVSLITKPFTFAALASKVRKMLDG